MKVSFDGFGENVLTFETQGTITAPAPVMLTANGKVGAASGAFCGICTAVRNGYAAVQVKGYVRVPYSGTAPTVGFVKLKASDGKAVVDASNGREYLVIDVDTTAGTAGIIL